MSKNDRKFKSRKYERNVSILILFDSPSLPSLNTPAVTSNARKSNVTP